FVILIFFVFHKTSGSVKCFGGWDNAYLQSAYQSICPDDSYCLKITKRGRTNRDCDKFRRCQNEGCDFVSKDGQWVRICCCRGELCNHSSDSNSIISVAVVASLIAIVL
ncbi:hypothetical protein PMAYCL1PPCAC_04700, partial [Pristionchus mayeri]